jgi:RTX calcium-binding nonapeptide repeat (4 copies)
VNGLNGWDFQQYSGTTAGAAVGSGQNAFGGGSQYVATPAALEGSGNATLDLISNGAIVNTAFQSVQTTVGETYTISATYTGKTATDSTPWEWGSGVGDGQAANLDLYWNGVVINGSNVTTTTTVANTSSTDETGYWYTRSWTVTGTGGLDVVRIQDSTIPTANVAGLQLDNVRMVAGHANGNDILNGGTGNDRIYGMEGNDTLIGGAGADTFYFSLDTLEGGNDGDDIITDFVVSTDKIVLTDVLDLAGYAKATTAGGNSDTTINLSDLISSGPNNQAVTLATVGADTVLTFGNGAHLTLQGVTGVTLASLYSGGSLLLTTDSFQPVPGP